MPDENNTPFVVFYPEKFSVIMQLILSIPIYSLWGIKIDPPKNRGISIETKTNDCPSYDGSDLSRILRSIVFECTAKNNVITSKATTAKKLIKNP